jgi:hypothetical protein
MARIKLDMINVNEYRPLLFLLDVSSESDIRIRKFILFMSMHLVLSCHIFSAKTMKSRDYDAVASETIVIISIAYQV